METLSRLKCQTRQQLKNSLIHIVNNFKYFFFSIDSNQWCENALWWKAIVRWRYSQWVRHVKWRINWCCIKSAWGMTVQMIQNACKVFLCLYCCQMLLIFIFAILKLEKSNYLFIGPKRKRKKKELKEFHNHFF